MNLRVHRNGLWVHTLRGGRMPVDFRSHRESQGKGRRTMSISKERLREIEAIKDEDIDYSDIPEAGEDFWRRAELQMPRPKKGVYVRLDADVLDWLKSKGKGYQTRLNAMLRALMESDRREKRKKRFRVVARDKIEPPRPANAVGRRSGTPKARTPIGPSRVSCLRALR